MNLLTNSLQPYAPGGVCWKLPPIESAPRLREVVQLNPSLSKQVEASYVAGFGDEASRATGPEGNLRLEC
jgi:hypothetical protein